MFLIHKFKHLQIEVQLLRVWKHLCNYTESWKSNLNLWIRKFNISESDYGRYYFTVYNIVYVRINQVLQIETLNGQQLKS